eukprot:3206007-Rhodomonas_salina.1
MLLPGPSDEGRDYPEQMLHPPFDPVGRSSRTRVGGGRVSCTALRNQLRFPYTLYQRCGRLHLISPHTVWCLFVGAGCMVCVIRGTWCWLWLLTRQDSISVLIPDIVSGRRCSGLENLCYFGDGPHECYTDRKLGARVGRHETTVDETFVKYLYPSENGTRSGT